uniref:Uncharacterized protein n=2 Tax=Meloidogyne TaxID=189290 RepID=A0A6V7WNK1_MELEN|nr:unnamed protein product [Meloidogyne enterolobii]CAD2192296.1 unnamed protein product [Meloidogyne enterolobii]
MNTSILFNFVTLSIIYVILYLSFTEASDYGSRSPGANDAHDPKKQLGGGR